MRRLMTFVLLLTLLVAAPSHAATDSTPSDPLASQATKDLLARLANLPNQSSQRLISGQWCCWHGFSAGAIASHDATNLATGHYPGIIGTTAWDGSVVSPSLDFLSGGSKSYMVDYWNRGGIIEIHAMLPNPETRGGHQDTTFTGNYADIYTDNGNALNLAYKADLDALAAGLQELEDIGMPVIFLPLSEMSSCWRWWSCHGTDAEFKLLWQYTFNYLTGTKGLHNLLFAYGPFYQQSTTNRYPGDAYVDIVGVSLYRYGEAGQPRVANGYTALVATGKPFALIEYGGLNACGVAGCTTPVGDLYQEIQDIKNNMPEVVYWLSWNENLHIHSQANANAALNDPWVANRDAIVTPPPPSLSVTIGWNASSDDVDVAGYNVLRCTIAPCTPTDVLASITAPALTYVDTTIVQGQSYSYAVNAYDAAGNISADSAPVDFGLVSTVRHTLAMDTFDRANNTDLGVSWDAGYTGQNNAQIISGQIRGISTASSAVETYNAITTPNDQWIQATLASWGTGTARGALLVRMANSPTWNGYACTIRDTMPLFSIERRDAGVGTVLATTDAVTPVAGDAYRCEIQGTTLRFVRIVGTVETQLLTATDATYPTGKTGVHINNQTDTANTELDNVVIGGFATSTQSSSIP